MIQDMDTMLDTNINREGGDGDPRDGRPKINAKPPSFRSVLDFFDDAARPHAEDDGPTSVADDSPFERRGVEGRRVPAQAPAAAPQASLLPTADDFTKVFFCLTAEEEEAAAGLLDAAEPSADDAAPRRTTAAAAKTSVTTTSRKHNKRKQRRDTATSATATSTKRDKRKQRRVSFSVSSTLHLLADTPPCSAMTPDERSVLWVSRSDLEAMKSCAQRSIKEMRGRVRGGRDGGAAVARRTAFRALMKAMEDETGSSVRGLEHRMFRRKEARRDLIRDVLDCQSHVAGLARFGLDREEGTRLLVRASRDRSLKARRVAHVDARDDFREVYGDAADAKRTLKRRKRRPGGTRKVSL